MAAPLMPSISIIPSYDGFLTPLSCTFQVDVDHGFVSREKDEIVVSSIGHVRKRKQCKVQFFRWPQSLNLTMFPSLLNRQPVASRKRWYPTMSFWPFQVLSSIVSWEYSSLFTICLMYSMPAFWKANGSLSYCPLKAMVSRTPRMTLCGTFPLKELLISLKVAPLSRGNYLISVRIMGYLEGVLDTVLVSSM